jgi:hypothetical protein
MVVKYWQNTTISTNPARLRRQGGGVFLPFAQGIEESSMTKFTILASMTATLLVAGCAGRAPLQPDRAVFSVDASYQRKNYNQSIEATFDRTVAVFREANYKLDVVDRATGQISGRRGQTGDKGATIDTDLRFSALILPDRGGSQVALRIVQIANQGVPMISQSKTEIVLNQPELYAYIFRRIESLSVTPKTTDVQADLEPMADPTPEQ